MSVFGGDSWGREAQHRKRRVDDLMVEAFVNNSSYKKLSNGKYACLVCPNNPLLDSSLMLSMHNKGSRHIAAESRLKERELMKQQEINKRIALSDGSIDATSSYASNQQKDKPLVEQSRKVASQIMNKQNPEQNRTNEWYNVNFNGENAGFFSPSSSSIPGRRTESSLTLRSGPADLIEKSRGCTANVAAANLTEQGLEFLERREKELKFTAAGWKRDCHGRWYRDNNVEFDSDEEDPNVSLS